MLVLVGDLNQNSLAYTTNNHVQNFFKSCLWQFWFSCDKSTHKNYEDKCNCNWSHVTSILLDFEVESGITKNDTNDHFGLFVSWGQL